VSDELGGHRRTCTYLQDLELVQSATLSVLSAIIFCFPSPLATALLGSRNLLLSLLSALGHELPQMRQAIVDALPPPPLNE